MKTDRRIKKKNNSGKARGENPRHKRAEESPKYSEESLYAIFEQSPLSIQVFSSNGDSVRANRAWEELWGSRREQLEGYNVLKDPQVKARGLLPYFEKALAGEVVYIPPVYYDPMEIGQKGRPRWTKAVMYPVKNASGQVREVVLTHEDVTERYQAERSMLENEERFRNLFENSPVAIWEEDFSNVKSYIDELTRKGITDLDAYFTAHTEIISECIDMVKVLDVNRAALKLYEAASKSDLIGRLNKTFPIDSLMGFKDELLTIAKGELTFQSESKARTLQGKLRDVFVNWVVAPGHEQTYANVLVSLTDITERKQAEEKLRNAEAKYRTLLEQIPPIVYTAEPEQHVGITYISPQIEKLGFPQEEWIADPDLWRRQLHPEDRGRILAQLNELSGSDEPFQGEYRLITRSGQVRWFYDNAFPVKDAEGRTLFRQGFMLDITERKQAETNIRQYADIVQNMQIGLYVFHLEDRDDDRSLRLVSANPAALQFSGTTTDEVVGETLDEGFPDLREQGIPQKYAEVIRSQKAVEIEVIYHDDSHRLDAAYAVKAFPLPNDHLGVLFESITERRQAEEKLRENETRLRNIIDNEPECIKILDLNGSILQMNPAGLAMIEADTIQTVMGKSVYPIVTPEYRQSFQDLTERVFKGESGKLEFEIVGLKGTRRWLNTHAVPLRNEQGDVTELLGITRDVTERRRAEEALRDSEKRFRALIENSSDEVSLLAADGSLLYESPSANPTLGYAAGEFLGQSMFQLVHPNDIERVQKLFSNLMQGSGLSLRDQFRLRHKSGVWRWVEAVGTNLLSEPAVQAIVVNYHDITESKQAEEAFLESQKRLQLFFNQSLDGFFFSMLDEPVEWNESVDKEGITEYVLTHQRITEANDAMLKQYKTTRENFIGRTPSEFFTHDLDQARRFRRTLFDLGHLHLETEERRDDGTALWIEGDYVCMHDNQGRITGMFGIQRDITERKQAEDALRQSEKRYRTVVENQAEFIMRWQPGGIRTFVNEAYCRYFGLTQEQALSSSFVPLIYEEDKSGVEEKISRLLSGITNVETETHRVITPEGRIGWQEWTDQAIYDDGGQLIEFQSVGRDVTERKQVEDALRKSEQQLSSIYNTVGDVIFHLAVEPEGQFRFTSVNPTFLKITGLTEEMVVGRAVNEVIPEPSLTMVLRKYRQAVEEHSIIRWEETSDYPAGQLTGEVSIAPVYNHKGDCTHLVGSVHDITERKRAEKELQVSEERFRQLAGNIQEVFWITDPVAQKDLYISPAYEQVWGRRLEDQLQDQNVFIESILPEDREMVLATIEKQVRGKRTEIEYRITRPDGSIRWIWDRAFPIFDESRSVKLVTGIAADITERKQAEAETLRHLAELQALYENGLAVGRLLRPQEIGERVIQTFTHYLSWHHVAIRLRRDEGDDLELVAFSVPNLQKGEQEDVARNFNEHISKVGQGLSGWVVQTGTPVRTGNVHTYPQYVNTYEAIQSGMYMPLKVGERVIGCISVESEKTDAFTAQDERLFATIANQAAVAFENARLYQATQQELFDRRHAEVMLEHERNSLAQRVEERTADLKRAIESLARALRVKDEFLANMSHELRTPLNAILGLSESLAEQVAGPLNEKQLKYVTTLSESGHHLLALINDILDLAKIEAGQITLDITRVDMESVCEASLRMIRQLAQKKNQTIELEIDRNFGLIWADERRLKQMIVNLLGNAVKFTPENRKIGLEVHGDKGENRVLITVWDDGIGIKENDLSQLFKPFVQLDSGLAREVSGTGLGLALVAQMARLHGGSVSVASMPGHGSRFTIVIPWEPALHADTIERLKITGKFRAIKPNDGSQKTILLIEDTKEVIMLIRDYLELAGYKVITAEDGIEGITQARLIKPDLILMDLQMPRMDGIEATQRLRSEPDFQYTPIIALTALAMPNDRERCLAAGMDEYISKPVNLKALVKIIQGFLAGDTESKNA